MKDFENTKGTKHPSNHGGQFSRKDSNNPKCIIYDTMDVIDSLKSLPIFTKTWLGLTFALTAAVTLDVFPPHQLVLDWRRVTNIYSMNSHESIELWRLLTAFCYTGAPMNEMYSLFTLYTIYTHSNGYERDPFPAGSGNRSADTIFGVLFCVICLLCTHRLPGYLFGPTYALYPVLARNLNGALLYLWSKRNPRAMIQLNFVPIEGQYLPFAHLALSLAMGNRMHELLHGFFVGHIYYYLIAVAPTLLGRRILTAPRILVELIGEEGNVIPEPDYQPRAEDPMSTYVQRDNATAAHIAAKLGNLALLRELAETTAGGRRRVLTASDRNGWQQLHEACRGGHRDIVRYLVVEQAEHIDVHATTNSGESPLVLAEQFHGENHPVTRLLQAVIRLDRDINQADSDGYSS